MKTKIKLAVEKYQCTGCTNGADFSCYQKSEDLSCKLHRAGTFLSNVGKIFLGMPKGFNRPGVNEEMPINIFDKFEDGWGYTKFNIPVWKHLSKDKYTLVRGICPRTNWSFLHIFLEDCIDKIDCLEITEKNISEMD